MKGRAPQIFEVYRVKVAAKMYKDETLCAFDYVYGQALDRNEMVIRLLSKSFISQTHFGVNPVRYYPRETILAI